MIIRSNKWVRDLLIGDHLKFLFANYYYPCSDIESFEACTFGVLTAPEMHELYYYIYFCINFKTLANIIGGWKHIICLNIHFLVKPFAT